MENIKKSNNAPSFFISRIDSAIDAILPSDSAIRGCAAIANAVLAYESFLSFERSDNWQMLAKSGANIQRPLWASTGVKDPAYDATRYVMQLVAKNTVNTMPEATMNAVRQFGVFQGDSITPNLTVSKSNMAKLALAGVDIEKITHDLELDGVAKFESSWLELMSSVKAITLGNV